MNEKTSTDMNLDPVDWEQLELLARLTPAERALAMMRAQAFVMAGLRGAFARRFPELSQAELNMKVLAYCTPIRGDLPSHGGHSSATDREEDA
jgi:hypothetical protein